ncbi:phosphoribosylaminoimidazole carboxylase [Rhodotorula toruloides]|uniref:Phosphoribosylaminoimidazole carboxylase n=1 Tax=Rhodotorula toruloides TaxID=5286 RepID=A0A511KAW1_RHOTO|nr:phosphoribosylaminoimidazole carboxylase [Rhodotorula toruloides]
MLLQAASPMAIPVVVLDPELTAPAKQASQPQVFPAYASSSAPLRHVDGAFTDAAKIRELAQQVDVLTVEIEHVNVAALKEVADECATTGGRSGKGIKVYPSPSIIGIIQDKYLQKVHLAKRGVPVAPFLPITADSSAVSCDDPLASLVPSVLEAGETFGYPLMLKSRHLAYDGKGNFVLRSSSPSDVRAALEALVPTSSLSSPSARPLADRLYAEKFAPFVKEVAVMVARGASGETRAYPAVETIHRDSVCHIVYAPLRPPVDPKNGVGPEQRGLNAVVGKSVNERAQEDAQQAIDALGEGAVGVFGVEMFLMADGSLLLNEIAPRPHNSGHYTIEACNVSQYVSHLYAILSLPLPPIAFTPPAAAMLNLLGYSDSAKDDFLRPDGVVAKAVELGAAIHLYGKAGCRKGRKMGHITVLGTSDADVRTKIARLAAALPGSYAEPDRDADIFETSPHKPFSSNHPLVSIVMGSDSDLPVMKPAAQVLTKFGVEFELSIVSAHRTAMRMEEFAHKAEERGVRVIIAGAGGAAHLPGMVASATSLPVVGVPVKASVLDGVDSLYSIVQMPRGIPCATVGINNSTNAALLAVRILSTYQPRLRKALEDYAHDLEDEVLAKVGKMEEFGWDAYEYKKN